MKKIFFFASLLCFIIIISCNNSNDKKADSSTKTETPKSKADSLMEDVMNGHDVGMGKMGKLSAMQTRIKAIIDSIAKLPSKTKKSLEPYSFDMNKVMEDLKSAKNGMEKWMDEFNMDSSVSNTEQRIRYLSDEKAKVSEIKENILHSLLKADSLIKQKF